MSEPDRDAFEDAMNALAELLKTIPDDVLEPHRERVAFEIDTGLYENTTLVTPDGETYPAGQVYLWARSLDGRYNVDIRQRNVPPDVDLVGCNLEIRSDDGIPLLCGRVECEPTETLGRSYSVKVNPGDGR